MKILLPLLLASLLPSVLSAQDPDLGVNSFTPQPAVASPASLLVIYELYALPQDRAVELLSTEHGNAGRYRRVLELRKNSGARLESLNAMAIKSGERSVLESVDEMIYPTDFVPPSGPQTIPVAPPRTGSSKPNPPPEHSIMLSPSSFETRNVGETLELEPVLGADGRTVEFNAVLQRVNLIEFRDFPGLGKAPATTRPIFGTQKLATSSTLTVGEPTFLGTLSPAPVAAAAQETWLAFLRILPLPEPVPPAEPAKLPDGTVLNFEYGLYSCPRAEAFEILATWPSVESHWDRLQPLLKAKTARCEHTSALVTRSGQKVLVEEIQEIPYASQYEPVWDSNRGGTVTSHSIRNVGVSLEIEPSVNATGTAVEVSGVPVFSAHRGLLQYRGSTTRIPAMPVTQVRKITTTGNFPLGRQMFVGTLNMPQANGVNDRQDDGRTWLLFMRCQLRAP